RRRNFLMDMGLRAMIIVALVGAAGCSSSSNGKTATSASNQSPERLEVMDRLDDAAAFLREFHGKLPESIVKDARCIVVVPSMVKGGLIVGGRHGDGFAVCRPDQGGVEGWSDPAPVSVSGGSAGLQIGLESVDLLMVVGSDAGMRKLLSSKFEIGADVS